MKNKVLAGLLSVIFPGLGHVYAGRYTDGMGGFIAVYFFALIDIVRDR